MSKNFVDTFLVLFILNILLITFGRTETVRKEILTARPVFDVFPTGTWHKSHRDIRIFDTFRLEQILINSCLLGQINRQMKLTETNIGYYLQLNSILTETVKTNA